VLRQSPQGIVTSDVQACRSLKYYSEFYALPTRCYELVTHFDQKWLFLQAEFLTVMVSANTRNEFLTVCITQFNT